MTSREIIRRVITRSSPPRIGFEFTGGNPADIQWVSSPMPFHPGRAASAEWGRCPELLSQVENFPGEVRLTPFGNIYGRLGGKTMGECVKGALTDGWELLDGYEFPDITMPAEPLPESDKFLLSGFPCAVFSSLRDTRLMPNALADTLLEPGNVKRFLDKVAALNLKAVGIAAARGVHGMMMADDLGTQTAPFISPASFRELFIPVYKILADAMHERGLKFFLHSCGFVYPLMRDLIEAGVDVFQFDQPELTGPETLASEFGREVAFYLPVDIQKIMPTGDRAIITEGAVRMVEAFKKQGGGLIAKDYPSWDDLGVEPEWQQWARDAIIANAEL
jgi:hypothetical protein